jgi:hypothetical protein
MTAPPAWSGSVFLTGHDPDFHAHQGGNTTGARHINQIAIGFILDPIHNPFKASGVDLFLFVESSISPPGGHIQGRLGIIDSGFIENIDFEQHDASTLGSELNLLGSKYSGIVVASDFGGVLTQAELDILNARSVDIIAFLNDGGGLYAIAESNGGAHLTPSGGHFGFLPFVVSSTPADQSEGGFTLSPFGESLGLTVSDINGNFSHNIFDDDAGLNVVDFDGQGRIISLAGRGIVDTTGVCQFTFDITPQTCPNPLTMQPQGVLVTAIMGQANLDLADIDVSTVTLAGVVPLSDDIADVGAPLISPEPCECTAAGPDGILDLALVFDAAFLRLLGRCSPVMKWRCA